MLLHMRRHRQKTGLQSRYMPSRPLFAHSAPLIMHALQARTGCRLGLDTPGVAGAEQHCHRFKLQPHALVAMTLGCWSCSGLTKSTAQLLLGASLNKDDL